MPNPKLHATHAVTIQDSPTKVWPWLLQLCQGRGGYYSYDWIENLMGLDIHTTDILLPEHQDLKVGDVTPLTQDGFGIPVAILEPEQMLVLYGDTRLAGPGEAPVFRSGDYFTMSWGYYLEAQPDYSTRLTERWLADWNPALHNTLF